MELGPGNRELDQQTGFFGLRSIKNFIEKLRDKTGDIVVAIDSGADTEHEYVFPYSQFRGPVDPSIDLVREQLDLR